MSSSNHLFIGSIIHWTSMDEMVLLTDGFVAVQDGKVISSQMYCCFKFLVINKHVIITDHPNRAQCWFEDMAVNEYNESTGD